MNSASPVICTSGRTSTPGSDMSTTSAVMPCCGRAASGSVRARQSPQVANCAYDVHTLRPVRTYPPSTGVARVDKRGEVAARVGLAEELAPDLLGREDRRQVAQPLVLAAVGQQCRADEVDADPVHRLGGLGTGVLALVQRDLHRRRAAPAVRLGPVHPDPTIGCQRRLPFPAPGDLVGQVDERGRAVLVPLQPLPERGGELLVLFLQREVHAVSLLRA